MGTGCELINRAPWCGSRQLIAPAGGREDECPREALSDWSDFASPRRQNLLPLSRPEFRVTQQRREREVPQRCVLSRLYFLPDERFDSSVWNTKTRALSHSPKTTTFLTYLHKDSEKCASAPAMTCCLGLSFAVSPLTLARTSRSVNESTEAKESFAPPNTELTLFAFKWFTSLRVIVGLRWWVQRCNSQIRKQEVVS